MPRENRRRGKRKKNDIQEDLDEKEPVKLKELEDEGQPSWIETGHLNETSDPDAPFGLCDPDIKAYFRSVENQLKEWQDLGIEKENVSEEDSNLERRMFFSAALTEMQGKECMLATDPDCAVILERMIYSMDDLARRIFMNNLIGSVVELAKHRFGSHVLETLFELGASTVSRETQGILPTAQALPQFADQPTMSNLVAQFCKEITPTSPALVNEQFASHVLQRLITLLVPSLDFLREKTSFRSKRSAGYKSKQGSLKSVFEAAPDLPDTTRKTPPEFLSLAKEILNCIKEKFSASEIRALAADQVACPTLRILVALESALGLTNKPDSLMDRILVGMISGYSVTPESIPPPSDYLATLLRDATASHLLETVVQHMPDGPFSQLWRVYFSGKLHRLAIHPVANFVVANTFERLNNNDFPEAVQEMEKVLAKSFKQHRIGPVTSLVKRAGAIKVSEDEVINAICMALGIDVNEPVGLIERILVTEGTADGQTNGEEQATTSQAPPSVQGALLLQAMLLLSAPHNEVVIRSFELMSKQTKIALAHDPTSSRVIDAMLESPVVTRKGKRGVIMGYLGQYEQLVDDRIGSRVGDRCWIHADPYLKEKIARSLIPHQQRLAASYYGKFFAKKLQLLLLLRKPDEWRVAQVQLGEKKSQFDATNNHYNHEKIPNPDTNTSKPRKSGKRDDDVAAASSLKKQATAENETIIDMNQDEEAATVQDASAHKSEKTKRGRKRKREEGLDEIDVLFSGVKENRFSKVPSSNAVTDEVKQEGKSRAVSRSEDLDNVLKAIKSAPKKDSGKRRKG